MVKASPKVNRRLVSAALALTLAFLTLGGQWSAAGPGCSASAASNPYVPGDYCWYFDTDITNESGADVTDGMFRVQVNTAGLIANDQIDRQAWSVYSQTGSYSNWVQTMVQDTGEVDSQWWIQVPSLPNGETRTVRTYFRNDEQLRNQGIYFTGNETVVVPDDATLDLAISSEVNIVFELMNTDETARDELIIDKHDGSFSGYRIGFRDNGGLELYSQIDNATACAIAWNSSWTDEIVEFNMNYDAASGVDTEWYVDGVLLNLCNTASNNTPNATTQTFKVGAGELSGAHVSDVKVYQSQIASNAPDLWLQFNPNETAETSAVDPTYSGTTADASGNGRDGTYTFTRTQTGFVVNNGLPQLVSGGTAASVPDNIVAVSGNPLDSTVFDRTENTRLPLFGLFDDAADDLTIGREGAWLIFIFPIAAIAGALAAAAIRSWLSFVIGFGLPYGMGNAAGVVTDWWLLVWVITLAGAYGLEKWNRQN